MTSKDQNQLIYGRSNFPDRFGIVRFKLSRNIWIYPVPNTLYLEIYSIERDDRLILLNGHKIRTKEKLIEKLAQDTDQLTLTVVDKVTETIFDQHNIDITEELGEFFIFRTEIGEDLFDDPQS